MGASRRSGAERGERHHLRAAQRAHGSADAALAALTAELQSGTALPPASAGPARHGGREPWRNGGGKKPPHIIPISGSSIWRNPFKAGFDGDSREVADLHERWFANQPELIALAKRDLKGKVLWCRDHPAGAGPCHGDTLLRVANT